MPFIHKSTDKYPIGWAVYRQVSFIWQFVD